MPQFTSMSVDIGSTGLVGKGVTWAQYKQTYEGCGNLSIYNENNDYRFDGSDEGVPYTNWKNAMDGEGNIDYKKICTVSSTTLYPVSTVRSVDLHDSFSFYSMFQELSRIIAAEQNYSANLFPLETKHTYKINTNDFTGYSESTFRIMAGNPNSILEVTGSSELDIQYDSNEKRIKIIDGSKLINVVPGSSGFLVHKITGGNVSQSYLSVSEYYYDSEQVTLQYLSDEERLVTTTTSSTPSTTPSVVYAGRAPLNFVTYESGNENCVKKYNDDNNNVDEQSLLYLSNNMIKNLASARTCTLTKTGSAEDILVISDKIMKNTVKLYTKGRGTSLKRALEIKNSSGGVLTIGLSGVYKITDTLGRNLFNSSMDRSEEVAVKLNSNSSGQGNMAIGNGEYRYSATFNEIRKRGGSGEAIDGGFAIGNIRATNDSSRTIRLTVDLWNAVGASDWSNFQERIKKFNKIKISQNLLIDKEALKKQTSINRMNVSYQVKLSSDSAISDIVSSSNTHTEDIYSKAVSADPQLPIEQYINIPANSRSFRYLNVTLLPSFFGDNYYYFLRNPIAITDTVVKFDRNSDLPTRNITINDDTDYPKAVSDLFGVMSEQNERTELPEGDNQQSPSGDTKTYLTVGKRGTGFGTIRVHKGDEEAQICKSDKCEYSYPSSIRVQLFAVPEQRSVFDEWQGSYGGKEQRLVILTSNSGGTYAAYAKFSKAATEVGYPTEWKWTSIPTSHIYRAFSSTTIQCASTDGVNCGNYSSLDQLPTSGLNPIEFHCSDRQFTDSNGNILRWIPSNWCVGMNRATN